MARNDLLITTLRAIRLLAVARWRVDDLAAELGALRRTAYRLLESIEAAGLHVRRQRAGRHMWLSIDPASIREWLPQRGSGVLPKMIRIGGRSDSIGGWLGVSGVSGSLLRARLRTGWPLDVALTEPPDAARQEYGRRLYRSTRRWRTKSLTQEP